MSFSSFEQMHVFVPSKSCSPYSVATGTGNSVVLHRLPNGALSNNQKAGSQMV